jgi:hypothetical protein
VHYWPGPDLKARTDLAEREAKQKAKEQARHREAPERLRSEITSHEHRHDEAEPSLVSLLWRRLSGR